uniref:Ribonuclease P and MRP subunit p25, a n=1 Tax=Callorhinchus milii TaxID=7868 RepID=A0A4W3J0W2_CALMI
MDNYRKVRKTEEQSPLPFENLPPDIVEMKVKEGSKIRNLMGFAMGRMETEDTRQIVFSGSGRAVTKTITCVEIMKRRVSGLHQITKLRYKSVQEVWERREPEPSAHNLTLLKNVPSICILLSKDPPDITAAGYQSPETRDGLWTGTEGQGRKRGRWILIFNIIAPTPFHPPPTPPRQITGSLNYYLNFASLT